MPEGHSIHRLARDHRRWFGGHVVNASSPQGRFNAGAESINGHIFRTAFAHGKHLFYEFERGQGEPVFIHIHLGLYGRFRLHKLPLPEPTPNVRLRLSGPDNGFDLSGPTCCEVLDDAGVTLVRQRLGPDPLNKAHEAADCMRTFAKRRSAIGSVLLDQKAIAGLGNIFRCELLFVHGIDPRTPANQLEKETIEKLWSTACEWLALGVKANRIMTTLPPGTTKVPRPAPKERVAIYKKARCPKCEGPVDVLNMANRKLFACLSCQVSTR